MAARPAMRFVQEKLYLCLKTKKALNTHRLIKVSVFAAINA